MALSKTVTPFFSPSEQQASQIMKQRFYPNIIPFIPTRHSVKMYLLRFYFKIKWNRNYEYALIFSIRKIHKIYHFPLEQRIGINGISLAQQNIKGFG